MSLLIMGAIYLATAMLYVVVTKLGTGERARAFKAVSPGMLPPHSVVFALLVGFLAAQVWNDANNPLANRSILVIFATGIGFAVILIAAHSRPFTGEISVSPSVVLQIMPEAAPGSR